MRQLSIISAALFFFSLQLLGQYNNPTQTVHQKLAGINKEWLNKNYDDPLLSHHTVFMSDEEVIQLHLKLVEKWLRQTEVSHLSSLQQDNRAMCLDYLSAYWQTGRFPKNTHHEQRTPYFIDDFGTACAVAHLMIQSGSEMLAKKVQAQSNYAYIRQMQYPELLAWADENGFSTDELAWIQPAYSTDPPFTWADFNAGADSAIHIIDVDQIHDLLYAVEDSGTARNNIRVFDGTFWYDLDGGVDGSINDILIMNGNVYAGGTFVTAGGITVNNVALWNGSEWDSLGSGVPGTVNALAWLKGELYAAGQFYYPAIFPQAVLVKWNGADWEIVLAAPDAEIYAMESLGNRELFIGGDFDFLGGTNALNIAKYDDINGLADIGGYPSPVRAIKEYRDTLYIGGDFTYDDTTYATTGFAYWDGAQIHDLINGFAWSIPWQPQDTYYIQTFWVGDDQLYISGKFDYYPMYGYHGSNAVVMSGMQSMQGLAAGVNGAINGTVKYNNQIVIGGDFTAIGGSPVSYLAVAEALPTVNPKLPQLSFQILNNPADAEAYLVFENKIPDNLDMQLHDVTGKTVHEAAAVNNDRITVSRNGLPAGLYLFTLSVNQQILGTGRILFQ